MILAKISDNILFENRFRLNEKLAAGGFGDILVVTDLYTNSKLILKLESSQILEQALEFETNM